ncbi:hypothetical protein DPMN_082343 [Dreissena polymorpha]|uniref:Uncharacterized protein n=1 Tax=Dreissena polymorpha TaxID=45954 RepID=A0A9D3Y9W3_DREPO|nr:hypothetical protein DPMN_082343 [Dreissena polymorpha]
MARGAPGLVMRPCIVEIYHIVIREVQYKLGVNRCNNEEVIVKGNFGWVWPMWAGCPRVGNGAMHINRCRNKEVIVKVNFGWAWSMWAGRPRIDRIVIRYVPYQFEVNRCRNEEVIVKGNFGWAWSMWEGRPRVGNGAMHNVQYQFEVNRGQINIPNIPNRFQGSSAYSVLEEITETSASAEIGCLKFQNAASLPQTSSTRISSAARYTPYTTSHIVSYRHKSL